MLLPDAVDVRRVEPHSRPSITGTGRRRATGSTRWATGWSRWTPRVRARPRPTRTFDLANRLTSAGGSTYVNDANGNTLSGGGRTMTWDSQNRMVSLRLQRQHAHLRLRLRRPAPLRDARRAGARASRPTTSTTGSRSSWRRPRTRKAFSLLRPRT